MSIIHVKSYGNWDQSRVLSTIMKPVYYGQNLYTLKCCSTRKRYPDVQKLNPKFGESQELLLITFEQDIYVDHVFIILGHYHSA